MKEGKEDRDVKGGRGKEKGKKAGERWRGGGRGLCGSATDPLAQAQGEGEKGRLDNEKERQSFIRRRERKEKRTTNTRRKKGRRRPRFENILGVDQN